MRPPNRLVDLRKDALTLRLSGILIRQELSASGVDPRNMGSRL